MEVFLDIALPVPLRSTFNYRYISAEGTIPNAGSRVIVPFGAREMVGIVTRASEKCEYDPNKIKNVLRLLDDQPILPESLLAFCHWASNYYLHPIGEVIFAALPKHYREGKRKENRTGFRHTQEGKGLPEAALGRAKKQQKIHQYLLNNFTIGLDELAHIGASPAAADALMKKGLIERTQLEDKPNTIHELTLLKEEALVLSHEQAHAFEQIRYHEYACYLIEGATGSGKTELYLQTVNRVLQSNRQALVLIPEIGLAAQTISRFKNRFNCTIAELHSNIAETERARSWHAAKTGEAKIVIGTRLASLTPFNDLGVIIIDEEHDGSYKQQDGFKYSARDLCVYRANTHKIPILLGSATPSLETLLNAKNGRYKSLQLKQRAGSATAPDIISVDLKKQESQFGLSRTAIEHLQEVVRKQEQALIFINRRGFAPCLICHDCGWTADCDSCDARMTVHKKPPHLRCHTCDRRRKVPSHCPNCASDNLITSGVGTEQLESNLTALFPDVPIIRIDRDSTRRKNAMEEKIAASQTGRACIFVGTQMLAKGHHLPALTLVVVVDADQGLLGADFRSLEHMGQLITQVAGRAGRAEKKGQVLIQTHRPDHPALNELINEGYDTFAHSLLATRKASRLPPYRYLAIFRSESKRAENSMLFLNQVKKVIEQKRQTHPEISILGPSPSALEKVNDRYRFILQVASESRPGLKQCLNAALNDIAKLASSKRTRWSLDIDPISAT